MSNNFAENGANKESRKRAREAMVTGGPDEEVVVEEDLVTEPEDGPETVPDAPSGDEPVDPEPVE